MASTLAICRISGTLPFAVSTVRPSSPIAGKERCVVMLGIGGLCLMPATWRVLVDNGDDESFSIIICTYHKMMLGDVVFPGSFPAIICQAYHHAEHPAPGYRTSLFAGQRHA